MAPNYELSYETGTLTVNKVALTVKANDKAKAYGAADPPFDYALSGLVNNDTNMLRRGGPELHHHLPAGNADRASR